MRRVLAASIIGLGFGITVSAAHAAPFALPEPGSAALSAIVEVAGGCGPGWHPVRWRDRYGYWHRRCRPNRYY
jgi:hypothetical protein